MVWGVVTETWAEFEEENIDLNVPATRVNGQTKSGQKS